MRNSWRNFFDIWAILFLNLKTNQNVFSEGKMTLQYWPPKDLLRAKRFNRFQVDKDVITVLLLQSACYLPQESTPLPKFICKTELIEIRSPALDTSSMIL